MSPCCTFKFVFVSYFLAPPSPGRTSVNARLFGNILEEQEPSPQKNSQSTDAEGEDDLLEKANER